jgi:sugar phosphate isomerase/epimerase
MRLSCNAHSLRGRPLRDALAAIREVGYEAVEVNWPQVERRLGSAESRADIFKAVLNETGLTVSAICVADMNAIDESEIEPVRSVIGTQIAVAASLQVGAVIVRGGDRRQQPFEILSSGLRPLAARSEACGISLLVANARGSAIEQIEDLRQLFMEIDHPRLGLALDAGRFHDAAVNPCDVLREFADRVRLIRISDRIARRCVPLGQGEMNVPAVIERARRSGYDGWLVVDPDVPDALEAQRYLADARSYLSTLLSDGR